MFLLYQTFIQFYFFNVVQINLQNHKMNHQQN